MSNSAVLRGKVSRCKSATEFPRKCGRCVKIERQNLLGKIVAATEFPGDRISCDTGGARCACGKQCTQRRMEDVGTVVPLLSSYKHGLVRRRLLQTLTGGVRLQRSSCSAHLFQFLLFFAPVFLAAPFIILDITLDAWSEYYLSLVYSCTVSLVAFGLRFAETSVRWRKEARVESAERDNALPSSEHFGDEEGTEVGSCCSYTTVRYLVHPKNATSLFLHSLLVTGLLSFASSLLLLPRVLNKHLPVAAAVVVGCLGWLASCVAHYSLNVSSPPEPATYRPTDRLKLRPLMRPTYIISIAATFIPVRYATIIQSNYYLI